MDCIDLPKHIVQANLEEADIRIGEIKKTSYEFDRDICKGAINARTNTVVAEKVVRHFDDKIKSRVSKSYLRMFYGCRTLDNSWLQKKESTKN